MRNYNYNWGKFLFIRWFVVSWSLQAIHVLDKSEMLFRIVLEAIPLLLLALLYNIVSYPFWVAVVLFLLIHTFFWLFDSTWLVGYREVNKHFKGKGIESIVKFVDWSIEELKFCDNITAIAIYGSICRRKYHDRSDFDFRIVQKKGSLKTYFKMIKLRTVAIWKFKIPIDLKLVDSVDFLKEEMREDEHPIIPYKTMSCFYNEGDSYEYFKTNTHEYLKEK